MSLESSEVQDDGRNERMANQNTKFNCLLGNTS